MSKYTESRVAQEQRTPEKCAQCPYLDTEHDPFSRTTRLYCQAPWCYPKRWFCPLPTAVIRA
jgi:hypothetical protein